MTETNPDPADVHPGTDRVELTAAERPECKRALCGYFDDLQAARAELARWVEDWGSFTPGECETGIHPDFAFDHEDSVTCPICAADKWKSEHDLSASITHQLQIETERLQAELAAANTRCAELDGQCVCLPPPATEGPQEDCPVHGRPYSEWVERAAALQATLDRVTAETESVIDAIEETFLPQLPSKALSYCAQEDVNAGLDAVRERFGLEVGR